MKIITATILTLLLTSNVAFATTDDGLEQGAPIWDIWLDVNSDADTGTATDINVPPQVPNELKVIKQEN